MNALSNVCTIYLNARLLLLASSRISLLPPAGAELDCLNECDCLRVFNERAIITLVTDDHFCPGLVWMEARVRLILRDTGGVET